MLLFALDYSGTPDRLLRRSAVQNSKCRFWCRLRGSSSLISLLNWTEVGPKSWDEPLEFFWTQLPTDFQGGTELCSREQSLLAASAKLRGGKGTSVCSGGRLQWRRG